MTLGENFHLTPVQAWSRNCAYPTSGRDVAPPGFLAGTHSDNSQAAILTPSSRSFVHSPTALTDQALVPCWT